MRRRRHRAPVALPVLMAQLTISSWETIARRTQMIAQGQCSSAEYRRMVTEKVGAALRSGLVMARKRGDATLAEVLSPWQRRATANAKRLRRR